MSKIIVEWLRHDGSRAQCEFETQFAAVCCMMVRLEQGFKQVTIYQ